MPRRFTLLAALAFLVLAPAAPHAETYPTRRITAVIPFPAGSGTDPVARFVGERVSKALKQPFVIENKPGANGALAAAEVARAAPDGHTILFGTNSTHAANPHLLKDMSYDPVGSFAPVTRVTLNPLMLVVRPEVPAASVREFIDHAKAHPGKLNYGTGNTGGLAATQMLKTMTGVDVVQVSYRGTPQAVTDLLGGRLHFMFTDPALVREHVEKGSLRALAVTSAERMSAFPDLPTMAESSLPKFEIVSWIAVFAPAGTPEAILATLNRELVAAIRDPEAGEFFRKLAMEPSPTTAAELAGFVESEIRKWGEVIAAAGLEKQ
jgi:tripartite-type tricarboxylate transporter receptor subunit TctC